jgi:DNA-binding PadR family transcriptional regulator
LALLAEGPKHGFALRSDFEARTGGTWPLNVGQVYTTLSRLVRDRLVEEFSREVDGSVIYRITDAGREEIQRWWSEPVDRAHPSRDELAIKLALALSVPGVDVRGVVQRQRSENLRVMQQYTQLKRSIVDQEGAGFAWRLVLDHLIFAAEAEARWLDHVDLELIRQGPIRSASQPTSPSSSSSSSSSSTSDSGEVAR